MYFSEEFISAVSDDPANAVVQLVNIVDQQLEKNSLEWTSEEDQILFEGYMLLQSIIQSFDLPQFGAFQNLTGQQRENNSMILNTLRLYRQEYLVGVTEKRAQRMINQFNTMLGSGFSYEFSKGDLGRIQELVNELRGKISECDEIESEHKQRLLQRLEKLQSELHKKMSDLDRFWGLVGDAGVILGKLGEDAKPFVDRIREIADIVWRTQSRAEELPSDAQTPLLQNGKSE